MSHPSTDTTTDRPATNPATPQPSMPDLAPAASAGQGLPARPIPLDELRVMLLHPSCSRTTRDHVWRHLIDQARSRRGAWMVAAVVLAIPMMRRLVAALADKTPAERIDREDLEAEVLAAFMQALVRVNLTWSHPLLRLSRLTQFAVLRALAVEPPSLLTDPDLTDRAESRRQTLAYPAGHPDLLLAQAVAEGVISELEADLIGFTRLEGIPLSTYCRRRGLLYCTALKRRQLGPHRTSTRIALRPASHFDPHHRSGRQHMTPRPRRTTPQASNLKIVPVVLMILVGIILGTLLEHAIAHAATATASHVTSHMSGHASGLVLAAPDGQPSSLDVVIDNLRNVIVSLLVTLATLFLTVGGVRYILAGGDPGEVEAAKKTLRYAALGYDIAVLAPCS